MPHIGLAVEVNMLMNTDVDPVGVTGSRPLMGHCVAYMNLLYSSLLSRVKNLYGLSLNIAKKY